VLVKTKNLCGSPRQGAVLHAAFKKDRLSRHIIAELV
jgi:hypothetical protein